MASRVVYYCDRCGQGGVFHLNLDVAEGEKRAVDLCVNCGARALSKATDGMGFAAKVAWLEAVLAKDPPPEPKPPAKKKGRG